MIYPDALVIRSTSPNTKTLISLYRGLDYVEKRIWTAQRRTRGASKVVFVLEKTRKIAEWVRPSDDPKSFEEDVWSFLRTYGVDREVIEAHTPKSAEQENTPMPTHATQYNDFYLSAAVNARWTKRTPTLFEENHLLRLHYYQMSMTANKREIVQRSLTLEANPAQEYVDHIENQFWGTPAQYLEQVSPTDLELIREAAPVSLVFMSMLTEYTIAHKLCGTTTPDVAAYYATVREHFSDVVERTCGTLSGDVIPLHFDPTTPFGTAMLMMVNTTHATTLI